MDVRETAIVFGSLSKWIERLFKALESPTSSKQFYLYSLISVVLR